MGKVIFIVGPTATGKSEVAFSLAKIIGGEIISCDSMLVYREPCIITSKPSEDILQEVRHHFIGNVSVRDTYDAFRYFRDATTLIVDLYTRGVPVIVCGGTGLYMSALLDGIFSGASRDEKLREELQREAKEKGVERLYGRLEKVDPLYARKISPHDLKRIIRALEVYYLTGVPFSQKHKERCGLWGRYQIKIFGLTMRRDALYGRINQRVEDMFARGAVDEVRYLLGLPLSITARKIIGIEEIRGYIEGRYSEVEARRLMARNTRHFAKRQFTWFKKDERIEWVDASSGEECCAYILRQL